MPTVPASHQDLLAANVAILTTIGKDGYPQVTALWFLADEDGLVKLSLNTARQKTKNLLANPQCTFFVIDQVNLFHTLEIRARAEITPDPDYVFADKLGAKYGGANLRTMDRPGESRVIVTLQPVKINTNG